MSVWMVSLFIGSFIEPKKTGHDYGGLEVSESGPMTETDNWWRCKRVMEN